jgi:hypothetical protein
MLLIKWTPSSFEIVKKEIFVHLQVVKEFDLELGIRMCETTIRSILAFLQIVWVIVAVFSLVFVWMIKPLNHAVAF